MNHCHILALIIYTSVLITSAFTLAHTPNPYAGEPLSLTFSHVILFSWDGAQYNHLMQLYSSGNLTNLKHLVNETRLPILRALITDHLTETNNAHPSMLSGIGQGEVDGCPDNLTVWENLEALNSTWATGSVAGKSKFTNIIFPYAHNDVDFWYAADTSATTVTDLAIDFIQNYSSTSFFLFIHYREPDLAAHARGENSQQYTDAIIQCDQQLGRIQTTLETENIHDTTAIVVTTDHGFQEGGNSHTSPAWGTPTADPNVYTTWIACNTGTVNLTEAANNYWDQNDVAPTIYSLIGIEDYGTRWTYIRGSALWDRCFNTRDMAITNMQLSQNETAEGAISINVTIQNQGDFTEIPTITAYYDHNFRGTKTLVYPDPPVSSQGRGASTQTMTFTWNTTSITQGTYTISADVTIISAGGTTHPSLAYTVNETDIADNTFTDGNVTIRPNSTHDVTIASLSVARNWSYIGQTVNLSFTVKNKGNFSENTTAEIRYDSTLLANVTITDFLPTEERTIIVQWNTTGAQTYIDYTLSASITPVPDEYNTLDNQITNGTVRLRKIGDVNGNGAIALDDFYAAARAFGSSSESARWNEYADINQDRHIDILDLFKVALRFGS